MTQFFAPTSPDMTETEKKNMELSRALARECMVLLENDGALPIRKGSAIALYGSGARYTVKGGTGSGDVNSRLVVTIEEGLKDAGYEIVTNDWLDRFDAYAAKSKEDYFELAKEEGKKLPGGEFIFFFEHPYKPPCANEILPSELKTDLTDTAIFVISRNSGEGADRYFTEGDYLLDPQELEDIKLLASSYKKFIIVLNIGGVMDLSQIKEVKGVNAILLMSQLGNIGGYALADVISGLEAPSGKLTDTWAKNYMDYPSSENYSHNNGNVDDEYYTEGIYVGYRYFDSFGKEIIYPFGHGKSYTDFNMYVCDMKQVGENIEIDVRVNNIGAIYAGKEVVQVYVSAPDVSIDKPYQELVAFAKTNLLPRGEGENITLSFPIKALASYCEECASWVLDKGEYVVRIGNDSRATKACGKLVINETLKTEECKNLFKLDYELVEIVPLDKEKIIPEVDYTITVDTSQIPVTKNTYQGIRENITTDKTDMLTMNDVLEGRCTVEDLVAQLTVEELANICVGSSRVVFGESIIGNASISVPGAAGDTSSICKESRGIRNIIMADGPAGLRLQPHFKTDLEGNVLPGGEIMGDNINEFSPDIKDAIDYYQYCTAIPIGWALAQSWNTDLVEKAADMVGSEMDLFGIDLWLAPALNIHRNPLCGRNFEYYSEDPLVSGKMAAAITRGIQKHKGRGVTIKHFAANSQEDNRYFTNAHVSERSMREIYLKGFEIVIKEAAPISIMTSYNLINGLHAANCYDLIQSAARDEWGFEGTVMTDWLSTQHVPFLTGDRVRPYPIASSVGSIYAGNDIQMPGCSQNVEDIIRAVENGEEIDGYGITIGDLQYNAANVIRVIAKMSK